jgi:hypothetical protein
VRKYKGKRSPGKPRDNWMEYIKIYHKEVRRCGVDWIYLDHDNHQWVGDQFLLNILINLRIPYI